MDRESADARTDAHSTPLQPDTEPSGPLTPAEVASPQKARPSQDEQPSTGPHISVELESSDRLTRPSGTDLTHGASSPAAFPAMTASPATKASPTVDPVVDLTVTAQSRLSPMASSKAPLPPKGDSNTTLQSMKRPEVTSTSVTQTRRFLSIERDLEQMNATIKLLEKRCARAENGLKIAWIAAAIAGAFGLLGVLL